jgi:hypothetical protein
MNLRKVIAICASGAALCGASLLTAPSASADQTCHQSITRPSSTGEGPTSSRSEKVNGWTEWTRSRAQWPNGGTGGWTCTRSNTWAKNAGQPGESAPEDGVGYPAGVGCVAEGSNYINFLGSWYVGAGAPVYTDSGCSRLAGSTFSNPHVVAAIGYDYLQLCLVHFPNTVAANIYGEAVECAQP